VIHLKHAAVELTDWGCVTHFADGASYPAQLHDTKHYAIVSHRMGLGDDLLRYAQEHELVHHIAAEFFHDRPSPVLWGLAHGELIPIADAAFEEAMVMTCHRWVRANERPIIGGVDWDALRYRALAVLNAAAA
jgi:hypothetical protein